MLKHSVNWAEEEESWTHLFFRSGAIKLFARVSWAVGQQILSQVGSIEQTESLTRCCLADVKD